MKIKETGGFFVGTLDGAALTEKDKQALLALANEDTADELLDLIAEAEAIAEPAVLFGVCAATKAEGAHIEVNGVAVESSLVAEKLGGKHRCFPYILTCGVQVEKWSEKYSGDILCEFWAEEIKKRCLGRIGNAFRAYIKEQYRPSGHLTSLNPGSLAAWPLSGQRELFAILGGRAFVEETVGVVYNESFLMLPAKTGSGILFESETFYENCQYCPIEGCPNRRADYRTEGKA